jgi:hypothetical protein
MFNKISPHERLLFFLVIAIIATFCCQYYYDYKNDKRFKELLAKEQALKKKNESLYNSLNMLRTSYYTEKANSLMLENQVNIISEYWKKEYTKVKDELFDLKNQKPK